MTPDDSARAAAPPDVPDSAQNSADSALDSVHEASASPSQPSPNSAGDAGQACAAESESGSQASESGETPEELAEETWLDEGGAEADPVDADGNPTAAQASQVPQANSADQAAEPGASASAASGNAGSGTPGSSETDPSRANADQAEAPADQAGQSSQPAAPADPSDMSAFEADVEDSELSKALKQIDQLTDDLAHARADLFNLNQQYGNYVRRSKEAASGHRESGQQEVVEALLGVLDDIDAARAAGDLAEGPFASIATKLEDTLKTKFHVERFGQAGEDFDPAHHEALLSQDNADVDHPVVAQVLQPGYRMGEKVLRATKVMVHNPQPDQSAGE